MSAIQGEVNKMTALSENTMRASQVAVNLQAIRRAILRYNFDADEASYKESAERETKAIALLQDAAKATLSEERRKTYNSLEANVGQLRGKREALGDAVKKMNAARASLFTVGDQVVADLAKVLEAAHGAERSIAERAADLETAVLLVRVANWRFLATRDPAGVATFKTNLGKAQQQIAALDKADPPQAVRAALGPVKTSLAAYAAAFETASTNLLLGDELYKTEVRKLTTGSLEAIATAEASLQKAYDETRIETDSTIASTITTQEFVAGLAFLLGGLIAFVIANGISTRCHA